MSRKPLMAGNWKMNLNHFEAIQHVQKLAFSLTDKDYDAVDVAVLVPFTDLRSVQTLITGDKYRILFGAQDVSQHASGAYTGEISASMLAKIGCTFVVVGHSERRQYHGETDATVAAKALAALKAELTPIVCVGEHLDVRKAGEHVGYCVSSLDGSLAGLTGEQVAKTVIAYEPVWAIGTGEVATPNDAQEVCAALRARLAEAYGPEVAEATRILYGGSVKGSNAAELMAEEDIDGALIGGASLDADDFVRIIRFRDQAVAA
jgi:triosephosphate isomerase (TIM)